MMFKNSIRLFCANFDKVWRYLVYQLLVWGIIFALLAPFYATISSSITSAWNGFGLGDYFTSGTLYGVKIVSAFSSLVGATVEFFRQIFAANFACGIYLVAVLVLVKPFLTCLGKFALQEMIYGYMSSLSKSSFTVCLLRTLKKSVPLALLKTLYCLPFDALILGAIYGMSLVPESVTEFAYALPVLIVLVPALLLALKELCTMGWVPARIVFDENLAAAFKKGNLAVFRRGLKIFSTAFVIFLLTLVLAMVLGLYSLIIILPCITPLLCIFGMVAFFSSQGMRFYVDGDTILTPKKLEEVDRIDKAKYLL